MVAPKLIEEWRFAMTKNLCIFLFAVASLLFVSACGGDDNGGSSSNSGDIETWLREVGNDFPDEAKCVAAEMKEYSVSDFENSFGGTASASFEAELDAAYLKCDTQLGITTEE